MKTIYLDHAAATPVLPEVLEAMLPYMSERFYNPSALYLAAKSVHKDIADARAKIAGWLGARPSEIVFTAGGTESDNLAIHGVMSRYPNANVVFSGIEHDAVLNAAKQHNYSQAPVNPQGIIKLNELADTVNDQTVLVSVIYASNEIGTIQPLKQVAKLIKDIRLKRRKSGNDLPIYLHTDASQAANYLDLHVSRLGVDLMTLNAGKIYGPKQCGALYVSSSVELSPQIHGGGQERGLRSGTENPAQIIGFARALDIVQSSREDESLRLAKLQQLFMSELAQKVPQAVINGSTKYRLPNNVHVTFPGHDNERLLMELDEAGIICAVGSACSASNEEPSHVLKAIGLTDAEAQASLRFTMGRQTSEADILKTVDKLAVITV